MTLSQAFEGIEGPEFAARANLASDLRGFRQRISRHPAVLALSALSSTSREFAGRILQRALRLSQQQGDFRYEHPHDSALASYVLVLSGSHPDLARIAARAVIATPRLWWSERIAYDTLAGSISRVGDVQGAFIGSYATATTVEHVPRFASDSIVQCLTTDVLGASLNPRLIVVTNEPTMSTTAHSHRITNSPVML